MRKSILPILLVVLISMNQILFAQIFSGGEGYSSEYDDYLYDFMVQDGNPYFLLKEKVLTYPETVYASMLEGLNIDVNPMYLGNEYSNLKFVHDNSDNIYITGIYSQTFINDTAYLFITKISNEGKINWTKLFQKQSDSISIFIDNSGNLYIHDSHFLNKLNQNGLLIWTKEHKGTMKLLNNKFYKIQAYNIHDSFFNGEVCDSLILEKIDTSGNLVFHKAINNGNSKNTTISTNVSFNIVDNRLFLSNSYWGIINLDPGVSNKTFENTKTSDWGKWGNVPSVMLIVN